MTESLVNPKIHLVVGFDPLIQKSGDTDRFLSWMEYFYSRQISTNLYCLNRGDLEVSSYKNFFSKYDVVLDLHYSDDSLRLRRNFIYRHALAVAKGRPPWIQNLFSKTLEISLSKNVKEGDLILFVGEAAGSYLPTNAKILSVWDKSNVLTFSTKGEIAEEKDPLMKAKYLYHHWLATRFEGKVLTIPSKIVATSEMEVLNLLRLNSGLTYELLKSVKGAYTPLDIENNSLSLAWIGSASYGPNWRGLIRFLAETDNFLIDNGYKIRIIGSRFTEHQKNFLRSFASVEFVGFAQNLDVALQGCKALVVPLWSGAGVKLKSLDALKFGIPLVSTPVGMEGIPTMAALGVSDSPIELARICISANLPTIMENRRTAGKIFLAEFTQEVFNENANRIFRFYDAIN